jgi:aspartate aminotransferase
MPAPLTLSARAGALQPSLTLSITAKARQLRAEGRDICSLSAGEPDFDTPAFIRQAAEAASARSRRRSPCLARWACERTNTHLQKKYIYIFIYIYIYI